MARPKLGSSETERLHMKITSEELAEIEDWRYANRVPSKSEAVRRLVQIGLRVQRALPILTNDIAEVLDLAAEAIDIPEEILAQIAVDEKDTASCDETIAHRLYDNANFVFNRQIEAQDNLHHLLVEISPLVNGPAFPEAVQTANSYASNEDRPSEEVMLSIGASRKVQLRRWRERREGYRRIQDKKGQTG